MAGRSLYCYVLFLTLYVAYAQFHRSCPSPISPKFVPNGCTWELITVRNCKWFNLTCSSQDVDLSCFTSKKSEACRNAPLFVFNKYSGQCELVEDGVASNTNCVTNLDKTYGFQSMEDCERKCSPPNVLPFTATGDKGDDVTTISDHQATLSTLSTLISSEPNTTTATTSRPPTSRAVVHRVDKLEVCRQGSDSSSSCEAKERFFFNRTSGLCEKSTTHQCPNKHNFATIEECQETCKNIEPCPVYEAPPAGENCRIIFVDGDDYCPEPEEECDETAIKKPSLTEEDKLKKCRSYTPKEDAECATKSATAYYYDIIKAVCVKKVVCSKADDLFKTSGECNEMCSAVPPCPVFAIPIVGPGCRIEEGGVDRNFCPSPPIVNCTLAVDSDNSTSITSARTEKPPSALLVNSTIPSHVSKPSRVWRGERTTAKASTAGAVVKDHKRT